MSTQDSPKNLLRKLRYLFRAFIGSGGDSFRFGLADYIDYIRTTPILGRLVESKALEEDEYWKKMHERLTNDVTGVFLDTKATLNNIDRGFSNSMGRYWKKALLGCLTLKHPELLVEKEIIDRYGIVDMQSAVSALHMFTNHFKTGLRRIHNYLLEEVGGMVEKNVPAKKKTSGKKTFVRKLRYEFGNVFSINDGEWIYEVGGEKTSAICAELWKTSVRAKSKMHLDDAWVSLRKLAAIAGASEATTARMIRRLSCNLKKNDIPIEIRSGGRTRCMIVQVK